VPLLIGYLFLLAIGNNDLTKKQIFSKGKRLFSSIIIEKKALKKIR